MTAPSLRLATIALLAVGSGWAAIVPVTNPGFEDITGSPTVYNEFTFGGPAGWEVYDRDTVTNNGLGPAFFVGTLTPQIIPARDPVNFQFFPAGAPEGQRVGIAFNYAAAAAGHEYGLQQTLSATLQPFTTYTLTVRVGNIASGYSVDNTFFNLDGFPGYRIDLMAGTSVIASDTNSLTIAEGQWALSTVTLTSDLSTLGLGEALRIRLVNLDVVDPGAPGADREVDFDDVMLTATAVPEPASVGLLVTLGLAVLATSRRASRR